MPISKAFNWSAYVTFKNMVHRLASPGRFDDHRDFAKSRYQAFNLRSLVDHWRLANRTGWANAD